MSIVLMAFSTQYNSTELTFSLLGHALSETYMSEDVEQPQPRFTYLGELKGRPLNIDEIVNDFQDLNSNDDDNARGSRSNSIDSTGSVDSEAVDDSAKMLAALLHDNMNNQTVAYFLPSQDGRDDKKLWDQPYFSEVLKSLQKVTVVSANPALSDAQLLQQVNEGIQRAIFPISQRGGHWITLAFEKQKDTIQSTLYDSFSATKVGLHGFFVGSEVEYLQNIVSHYSGLIKSYFHSDAKKMDISSIIPHCLGIQNVLDNIKCGPTQRRVEFDLLRGNPVRNYDLSELARLNDELKYYQALTAQPFENLRDLLVPLKAFKEEHNSQDSRSPAEASKIQQLFHDLLGLIKRNCKENVKDKNMFSHLDIDILLINSSPENNMSVDTIRAKLTEISEILTDEKAPLSAKSFQTGMNDIVKNFQEVIRSHQTLPSLKSRGAPGKNVDMEFPDNDFKM